MIDDTEQLENNDTIVLAVSGKNDVSSTEDRRHEPVKNIFNALSSESAVPGFHNI